MSRSLFTLLTGTRLVWLRQEQHQTQHLARSEKVLTKDVAELGPCFNCLEAGCIPFMCVFYERNDSWSHLWKQRRIYLCCYDNFFKRSNLETKRNIAEPGSCNELCKAPSAKWINIATAHVACLQQQTQHSVWGYVQSCVCCLPRTNKCCSCCKYWEDVINWRGFDF